MRVYRIGDESHAKKAFNGDGARIYGGRWNKPGVALVYASATLSLAALELLVHLDAEEFPTSLVVVSADIPQTLPILEIGLARLPVDWQAYPGPETLQSMGTHWVKENHFAVISVPSAIIPSERNFLVNPKHPDFSQILIHKPAPFTLDPRLWRKNK